MPTLRCNCCQAMHRRCRHGRYVLYIGMEYLGSTTGLDIYRAHDAALYELPPKRRRRGQQGRHATRGKRLPTPQQIAARRKKGWKTVTVSRRGKPVQRRVLGITCLWYHVCRTVPIRMVIVRDPAGRQEDDFFFCTVVHEGRRFYVNRTESDGQTLCRSRRKALARRRPRRRCVAVDSLG